MTVDISWQALTPTRVTSAYEIAGTDPKATNSFEDPEHIVARAIKVQDVNDGTVTLQLPPLSFTAVVVAIESALGEK
jgi:alpha-N-arabinofuranosidase